MIFKKRELVLVGTAILGLALATTKVWTADTAVERAGRKNDPQSQRQSQGSQNESPKTRKDDCQDALCVTLVGELSIKNDRTKKKSRRDSSDSNFSHLFRHFESFLGSSDVVFAGLRTSSQQASYDVGAMSTLGVNAVSLANDHSMNIGHQGLVQTTRELDTAGINWFGISNASKSPYEPFRWQRSINGKLFKLAIFGVSRKTKMRRSPSPPSPDWQLAAYEDGNPTEQIRTLRAEDPDVFVVVYPYWGRIYRRASIYQQDKAREWIDAGADLVVGYGTHMIQTASKYKGKWIVYGMGDFFVDSLKSQKMRRDTVPYHAALRLVVEERKGRLKTALRLYPFYLNRQKSGDQLQFLDAKQFGEAYWRYLTKGKTEFNRKIKQKLMPGTDYHGRFITLK